jgi:hypothetical protein
MVANGKKFTWGLSPSAEHTPLNRKPSANRPIQKTIEGCKSPRIKKGHSPSVGKILVYWKPVLSHTRT